MTRDAQLGAKIEAGCAQGIQLVLSRNGAPNCFLSILRHHCNFCCAVTVITSEMRLSRAPMGLLDSQGLHIDAA